MEMRQMTEASFPVEMAGGVPVVTAPVEIDVTNAAGLRAALLEAAGQGSGTLVVDMSRTAFCDSSAVNALVRAHQRAQAEGGEVLLAVSAAAVLRILALIGVDGVIPSFSTLDEALGRAAAPTVHPPVPAT
jgi:anti-sigma B factor antagonist